jgi:hypothetical protein
LADEQKARAITTIALWLWNLVNQLATDHKEAGIQQHAQLHYNSEANAGS